MNINNNYQLTNTTAVTENPTQTNIHSKNKRYTATEIANKQHTTSKIIEDVVICTQNEQQKQQVIDFYNREYHASTIVKLDNNNNLNDNDLLNVITCKQAGNIEVTTGRLFNDEPLLLIIDLTTMDSGEIASLNDLLSVPATYNGNPISNNVKIAIIINEKMLKPGINKPSADLWRRLAKFNFYNSVDNLYSGRLDTLQQAKQSILNTELLTTQIQSIEHSPQNKESTIINFTAANSWQELLFGSLTLNDKGKIYFNNGYLSNITNNNLVLHDAPWDNDEFTDTLATTLRQSGFRANGVWVNLPENLLLTRSFTTKQQLAGLTEQYVIQAETIDSLNAEHLAIINSYNLESILVNNQLQDGIVIATDTLAILTADCNYLLITEDLTKKQWLNLLNRVSVLGNNSPKIINASNSSIVTINKLMQDNLTSTLQCKTYKHKVEALAQLNNQGLVYQVTPDTNWLDIWQNISLISQENFTFATQDTELLTSIKQGKRVSFYGLETNHQILQQFESLLIEPSYLFLNGNKIPIASNNICILLPENINQAKLPKLLQSVSKTEIVNPTTEQTNTTEFIERILEKLAANNIVLAQDSKTLSDMFIKQSEIERQQDQAEKLLPIHYRKAAHNVFAKQHRDNPAFYSYLKTQIRSIMPDDNYEQAVDAEALRNWISQNPNATRNSLSKDFWLLARHCSPIYFSHIGKKLTDINFAEVNDKKLLDKLANIMLSVVADGQKQKIVTQFDITEDDTKEYICCYNGSIVAAITNAMFIAADKLKKTDSISLVAKDYAFDIYQIIQKYPHQQQQAINEVYKLLLNIFPEDILQTELSDLASTIVASQVNISIKQSRKKQRLAARIKQHPIIFLQGLAGVGKSHMAQAVVTNLKNYGYENMPEPLILSLGPQIKASDLFGSQQLQHVNDDAHTEFVAGPLLKWAMNDNPPLLILDEANLVEDGVLAPLAGLTNSPPQLSYAGKAYRLSEKHRVIITGNPENYDGRHMDNAISATMLTLHYQTMTDTELAELIIKPALTADLPKNIKAEIIKATLYLYNEYSKFIDNDLGPRDLHDILARINKIIDHHGTNIELPQVYSLAWEGFTEILTSSVTDKSKLKKIFNSYKTKFAISELDSSILLNRDKKFEDFFNQLTYKNPELDLFSIAVKKLVKDYWLFIDSQSNLQGRRGLWVEGPAGWGKDIVLTAVLDLWEQQESKEHKFIHINANPNQYDKTQELIADAMQNGKKVIISEINLLPSRYLEGLFNAILTGRASPSFMLFATVNPSSYSNREQLSPAFMNRMTQVKLEPISNNELYKILLRRYGLNKPMVDWLFMNYLDLATALKQQQAPIQLSLANLLETAAKLDKEDDSHWLKIFQQDYGLAQLIVKDKTEELTAKTPPIITVAQPDKYTNKTTPITTQTNLNTNNKISTPQPSTSINNATPTTKAHTNNYFAALKAKINNIISKLYSNNYIHKIVEFNDITQAKNFYPIKFFATDEFTVSNYRVKLYRLLVTENILILRQITIASEQIEIISAPAISNSRPIKLETGQLLGTAELELSNNKWVALPGISYHDQCIGISYTDLIELGRCPTTSMLVVKLKDSQNSPQEIKLDFIIKPNLISLTDAKVVDDIEAPYQDTYLKELLDEKIFSPNAIANNSIKKLQQIKLITDKKQQIKELVTWASSFKDDMDITSEGADALIDSMRYKTGTCQHRSIAFQILAEYFGIPTNCISNNLHMFVEFSLDNKQTWISVDLDGSHNPDSKIETIVLKFLASQTALKVLIHQEAESNKNFDTPINSNDTEFTSYSQANGMLVVKLKDEQKSSQNIKLDFIIKPTLISLADVKVVDDIEAPYQDTYLKELLDEKIFSPNAIANNSIKKLQQIKLITDKKQQIKELVIWASSFKTDMEITSEGADALIDAMRYKTGTYRHRSIAFKILAEYFGIPTNCISNNLHMLVKFSLDNKQTWISVDLDGSHNYDTKVETIVPKFWASQTAPKVLTYQKAASNKNFDTPINSSDTEFTSYSQAKEYLQSKPDQLINFLKFVSLYSRNDYLTEKNKLLNSYIPNYNYLQEIDRSSFRDTLDEMHFQASRNTMVNTDDLYGKNFYTYVNSTTYIFSEVLPDIFNAMIKNTQDFTHNFILLFFKYTYKQFQQGKIPEKTAQDILYTCLPLLEDNVFYNSLLINEIEYLAKNGRYQDRAERILVKYYSAFKKNISLNYFNDKTADLLKADKKVSQYDKIFYKSQVLARLLKQTIIKTDWSYTTNGGVPNINRLVSRKPAFPINKSKQNIERDIYMYIRTIENCSLMCLDLVCDLRNKNPEVFSNINFFYIFSSFYNWLFKQISAFRLNLLLDKNINNSRSNLGHMPAGYITVDTSMFTNSFYIDICRHSFRNYHNKIEPFYNLNPDRIKQVFGNSAVLITTDVIVECFKEFLELCADKVKNKSQ